MSIVQLFLFFASNVVDFEKIMLILFTIEDCLRDGREKINILQDIALQRKETSDKR